MKFKLSEKEKEKLISLYNEKVSIKKLAEKYRCNCKTMSAYLKSLGITPTKQGYKSVKRFSEETEKEIISLYENGMCQKDIATKLHTYNTSVRRVLLRNNVIIRDIGKVNRLCKHNPFKRNDELSEYFLGLLLTDGCLQNKRGRNGIRCINLSLKAEDDYLVKTFRDWASPNTKLSYIKSKKYGTYMCSCSFTNEEANNWLVRKGQFYNKSYNCKIYCSITWNILRGIFDGDGGFAVENKKGLRFFICGFSEMFIDQILYFLTKNDIKAHKLYVPPCKNHKNGLYYINVYNNSDIIKIGLNMYSNAHIYLKRKYEKWLTFYESRRDKYTLNSGKEWHSNPEQNLPTLEVI